MSNYKPRKVSGSKLVKLVEDKVTSGHIYPTAMGLAFARAVNKTFNPKPSTRYKE